MSHRVESGDVRAIHQTRVASRRLRELLPILQVDAATSRKLERRLRKVTRRLGRIRELDVMALEVGELRSRGSHDQLVIDRLADQVAVARSLAFDRLGTKVWHEFARLPDKLGTVAAKLCAPEKSLPRPRGWRWVLDARIARRAATLNDALRASGAVYLPERLHAVRIATKKLRYAVELSVEATGERTSPELQALKRSQQVLGRLHDLQMLIDFIRTVQARLKPSEEFAMRRPLEEILRELENRCRRLHARHMRERSALLGVAEQLKARSTVGPRSIARRTG